MPTESPEEHEGHGSRPRVLIVDDDGEMRALLADVLSEEGYQAEQAANGAETLIRLRTESFAAIVLDKNMPGLSGLDLLPGLRTICPETPVILITAFGEVSTYAEAMEKGASEYIFKPFYMAELLQALRQALRGKRPVPSPSTPGGIS